MERKCMICGAELGEREKYCGNCGAKAPDGAAEKEEIEPKYITKEKPHEPWMDHTWKAQNFFFNLISTRYKHRFNPPLYNVVMIRFFVFGIIFITTSFENLQQNLDFIGYLMCLLDFVFGICLCFVWLFTFKICNDLVNFKDKAPLNLYINCLVGSFIWWLHIGITGFVGEVYIGFIYTAIFEFVCGISALMISIKYYEKRKSAFIN